MAQIIVDTDYYSLEEIAEEIILRQETTRMPWKMAITSVLDSYVVPTQQEVKREQPQEQPKPAKRRGRPRKNPVAAHADVPGATRD